MKKSLFHTLLIILMITVLTGCDYVGIPKIEKLLSSTILRTVGLGENSMPIDKANLVIELFNDQAISIDKIKERYINYYGEDDPEDVHEISGKKLDINHRYFGVNARYGINNLTEIKIGAFFAFAKNGYRMNYRNDTRRNYYTTVWGQQLSIKRLLTDYDNPHRLSLYGEGKYFTTHSKDIASKYDAVITEFKSSLIYGYLADPKKRHFPSLALYFSQANTRRDQTYSNIPLKNQIQALGLETNYNIDARLVSILLFTGLEKEISANAAKGLKVYFGVKYGFNVNRNK